MKISARLLSFLLFPVLSFSGLHWLSAEPSNTPPGLIQAPPCSLEPPAHFPDQAKVPCNAIVLFEEGTPSEGQAAMVEAHGGKPQIAFHNIAAMAVHFPNNQSLEEISAQGKVVDIIPDRPVQAFAKPGTGGGSAGQVTPAGVSRIGAPKVWPTATGAGVGVAIVDTGLDFLNSDLNVADPCHDSFGQDCQDRDGHGTHVGGIVAALNNSQGVVGVAPGGTLYAVRVLDANGFGTDSTVMAGLDWVLDNADQVSPPIRVVNMSLGREGTVNDNSAYHAIVQQLSQAGISVVVAAGNDSSLEVADNVPATYPEVIAVASSTALGGSNQCRNFSGSIVANSASYFTTDGFLDPVSGIGVTISAPGDEMEDIAKNCFLKGTGILSTRLGGGTTRMSGTSMASPHVAGVLTLVVENHGGSLDPEVARDILRNSASLKNQAPFNSPASGYSFDGEREGILSACGALGVSCL